MAQQPPQSQMPPMPQFQMPQMPSMMAPPVMPSYTMSPPTNQAAPQASTPAPQPSATSFSFNFSAGPDSVSAAAAMGGFFQDMANPGINSGAPPSSHPHSSPLFGGGLGGELMELGLSESLPPMEIIEDL